MSNCDEALREDTTLPYHTHTLRLASSSRCPILSLFFHVQMTFLQKQNNKKQLINYWHKSLHMVLVFWLPEGVLLFFMHIHLYAPYPYFPISHLPCLRLDPPRSDPGFSLHFFSSPERRQVHNHSSEIVQQSTPF